MFMLLLLCCCSCCCSCCSASASIRWEWTYRTLVVGAAGALPGGMMPAWQPVPSYNAQQNELAELGDPH